LIYIVLGYSLYIKMHPIYTTTLQRIVNILTIWLFYPM
jgi:hypothetical protein